MPDFFNTPVVCNAGPILGLFRVNQVGLLDGMRAKGYFLGPRLVAECLRLCGE